MADFGWYANPPYSVISSPAPAAEMWIFGLKVLGVSSILGSINFVVTILKCKHPDLSLGKVPLLAWSFLSSSIIVLAAMPTFAAALLMLLTDRLGATGFFNPAMGGDPIAYQHLFWFTFHPEVYVLVIPAIGMMYEIIPRFSRRPIFSHSSGVAAFVILSLVAFASWAHHMFATGMTFTEKTVFMIGTLAAVPASAMHVFNFLATMWNGRIKFATPMMWAVGGIALFFAAGAGGVVNTAMPLDFITMLLVSDVAVNKRRSMTKDEKELFGINKLNVKRSEIPAVTHVDYSARVQTVHKETNSKYYKLLSEFKKKTGCPVLVNTSFNVRGEPIVNTPEEAFNCFMGTELDVLAIGTAI